ncbi:glutathione S-transferase family protein, partial [Psychrobacter sp. SIMBA_152]
GIDKSNAEKGHNSHSRVNSAYCQSIVAEMHSGLTGIRNEMPMNIRATAKIQPSSACLVDIARIEDIFADCLKNRSADSFLFEDFTVVDVFFAPVVL